MISRFFITLDFGEASACYVKGSYETSPPSDLDIIYCRCDNGTVDPTSNIFLLNLERKLGIPPYTFANRYTRKSS